MLFSTKQKYLRVANLLTFINHLKRYENKILLAYRKLKPAVEVFQNCNILTFKKITKSCYNS